MNQRTAGIALSYATLGVQVVVMLAYTPFVLRILGQEEFGLYQLVQSVIASLGMLSLGFSGACCGGGACLSCSEAAPCVRNFAGAAHGTGSHSCYVCQHGALVPSGCFYLQSDGKRKIHISARHGLSCRYCQPTVDDTFFA